MNQEFKGLTNQELMMVYYRFDKHVTEMNENLSKNMISKVVDTPFGKATAMINVPPEHIEEFKKSEYYALLNSVVNKLRPIVSLIEDCDPAMQELSEYLK